MNPLHFGSIAAFVADVIVILIAFAVISYNEGKPNRWRWVGVIMLATAFAELTFNAFERYSQHTVNPTHPAAVAIMVGFVFLLWLYLGFYLATTPEERAEVDRQARVIVDAEIAERVKRSRKK